MIQIQDVKAGDLIKADFMNQILAEIRSLDDKISGISPTQGQNAEAASTFMTTWEAYRGFIKQKYFQPTDNSGDAVTARVTITSALQDIMMIAVRNAPLALQSDVDPDQLIDAFARLYSVQHDLVVLFQSAIVGTSNGQDRITFAGLLNSYLEVSDASGALCLKASVDQNDLSSAILAQNRINGFLLTFQGAATKGTIDVLYQSDQSSRGETLVIGDQNPYDFAFRVTNKTNQTLTLQLQAQFLTPKQSWSSSITKITKIDGTPITSISLSAFDQANPNDPKATQVVKVLVTTPASAVDKERATLQLTASAPAPVNIADYDSVELAAGTAQTPTQTSSVHFSASSMSGSPDKLKVLTQFSISLPTVFHTSAVDASRDFTFKVDAGATTAEVVSLFAISYALDGTDLSIDNTKSTDQVKVSNSFTLKKDVPSELKVITVSSRAAVGKQLTFSVVIASVSDGIEDSAGPFTLSVTS